MRAKLRPLSSSAHRLFDSVVVNTLKLANNGVFLFVAKKRKLRQADLSSALCASSRNGHGPITGRIASSALRGACLNVVLPSGVAAEELLQSSQVMASSERAHAAVCTRVLRCSPHRLDRPDRLDRVVAARLFGSAALPCLPASTASPLPGSLTPALQITTPSRSTDWKTPLVSTVTDLYASRL